MLAKKPKGAVEKRRKSSSVAGFFWMLLGAILTLMIGVFLYLSPVFDFSPASKDAPVNAEREVKPKINTDKDNGDYEFYDVLPNQEMATIPDESVAIDDGSVNSQSPNIEPDVVVTEPTVKPRPNGSDVNIQEQTTVTPTDNNGNGTPAGNNQIVVVEENATYDGSSADDAPSSNAPSSNDSSSNNSSNSNANNAGTATVAAAAPSKTYILQINSFGSADEADRRRAQVLMAGVDAKVVKKTTGNGQPLYQVISRPMNSRQAVASAQLRLQNNGIDSLIVEQRRD